MLKRMIVCPETDSGGDQNAVENFSFRCGEYSFFIKIYGYILVGNEISYNEVLFLIWLLAALNFLSVVIRVKSLKLDRVKVI